jgi:hypothetical protein
MKWQSRSRGNHSADAKTKAEPVSPVRDLTDAELADALAAYRGGTYCVRYMNPGKGSATIHPVMGVMDFQAELALVAATPRPWRHPYDKHVPAVLRLDAGRGVAVRIDGYLVGYLTPDTATATRPLVEELAGTGQSLVCAALIVGGGDKSYGIRLQIRPGAATRWAAGTKPAELA